MGRGGLSVLSLCFAPAFRVKFHLLDLAFGGPMILTVTGNAVVACFQNSGNQNRFQSVIVGAGTIEALLSIGRSLPTLDRDDNRDDQGSSFNDALEKAFQPPPYIHLHPGPLDG